MYWQVRQPFEPPYEGPFEVITRKKKYFVISKNGKHKTDQLKPTYELVDNDLNMDDTPNTNHLLIGLYLRLLFHISCIFILNLSFSFAFILLKNLLQMFVFLCVNNFFYFIHELLSCTLCSNLCSCSTTCSWILYFYNYFNSFYFFAYFFYKLMEYTF